MPSDAAGITVAVAHYPEGAGHATRMLAVGRAFAARGAEIALAGGGPGTRFLAVNGYAPAEPTTVDFIADFQQGGSLRRVLRRSVPRSLRRVRDYVRWLRREDPTLLVTDDVFAALAAPIARTPVYVLTHDVGGLYDGPVEPRLKGAQTRYQRRVARAFYYPAVWHPSPVDPPGVEPVPPIALQADAVEGAAAAPEVLLVPSAYSSGFAGLADRLDAAGHEVLDVGSDAWDPVPSLLPTVRAAEVVVCAGYSAVMEAAVAGTPCVIAPATAEQRGVARTIRAHTDGGFAVADSAAAVAAAVDAPPDPPSYENGAGVVADRILADR